MSNFLAGAFAYAVVSVAFPRVGVAVNAQAARFITWAVGLFKSSK